MFIIYKFYDTNALLKLQEKILESNFYISSISLYELEDIKTSNKKDEQTKYRARNIIRILNNNYEKYIVVFPDNYNDKKTNDELICECANKVKDRVIFITDDLCCRAIADWIYGLQVYGVDDINDNDYSGYKEVILNDEEMAYLYEHLDENNYDLYINEYLIIKDINEKIVDKMCWTGNFLRPIKTDNIKSEYFGSIKPKDIYQQFVLDSFNNNQITMVKGRAGTGKSHLAIGYLLYLLEKHKIDKIIVFCNTVATANSAKLGYYPGTKDEKLLDSSIGNMLASKLGGLFGVEELIQNNKLVLLPLSDIRGYDTSNMNAGIYITEAQNMDISLMKLSLQRIGEDCICIIDGDYNTQVDMFQYNGANNGMRRASKIFRGQDFYGEIELKQIYRSRIAEIADDM